MTITPIDYRELSAHALGAYYDVAPEYITDNMRSLNKRGLISIKPLDREWVRLSLTQAGRDALKAANERRALGGHRDAAGWPK